MKGEALNREARTAPEVVDEETAVKVAVAEVTNPTPGAELPGVVVAAAAVSEAGFGWVRTLARDLVPFLKPHARMLGVIAVLLLVELGLEAAQRKAMGWLLDEAILKGQPDLLFTILGLLLAAVLVCGAVALGREFLYSSLAAQVPAQVRTRIFEHVQLFPLQRLRTNTHGDMIARMTSDSNAVEPAIWSLGYTAVAIVGIAVSFCVLVWTEWRLTLIGVALLPLAVIGPRYLSPRAAAESYRARQYLGALATHLYENLANQIVLRVFGLARFARGRFGEHNDRIVAVSRRYNVFSYYSHRVPSIVIEVLQLVVLGIGGWFVLQNQMTPGELIAFHLLFASLCNHLWSITANVPSLIEASAGMRRVREVLDQPVAPPHDRSAASFAGIGTGVRFDGVSFSYDGTRDDLADASLEIARGTHVAFVGASGSGKSTALQLLLGLQVPRRGRIAVGGTDLANLALADYWSKVSAVFQDSLLFHASIADNIRAGRLDATDAEVERAAEAADIAAWVRTLPEGYGTIVAGDTCSGGQRQRLAIARALVRNPELLVLDEPTSALDAATGAAVMKTLRSAATGRTVVLVTHNLVDAAEADRIVVFERGRIVESGTHAELLARGGAYASLWSRQRGVRDDGAGVEAAAD